MKNGKITLLKKIGMVSVYETVFCWILGPTDPFMIKEPQDQEIGNFCVFKERRVTDFETPKS